MRTWTDHQGAAHPRLAVIAAVAILVAATPVLLFSPLEELADPLTLVLAIGASVSVLFASVWEGSIDISAAFVCFMLAVAFIGPVSAFLIAVIAEAVTFVARRYRPEARPYRTQVLPINLAATAVPNMLAALLYGRARRDPRGGRARATSRCSRSSPSRFSS